MRKLWRASKLIMGVPLIVVGFVCLELAALLFSDQIVLEVVPKVDSKGAN